MGEITERTRIPLSLVFCMAGVIFYFGKVQSKVLDHDDQIQKIEAQIQRNEDSDIKHKDEVIDRLARLETLMKQILKQNF